MNLDAQAEWGRRYIREHYGDDSDPGSPGERATWPSLEWFAEERAIRDRERMTVVLVSRQELSWWQAVIYRIQSRLRWR